MNVLCLGNPGLAYDFRATPKQAIDFNVHDKRPSLCRHFLPLSSTFSLYSHPSIRTPLAYANCSHWASANFL
ncbi:hypothetical protein K469DRAFT_700725 [Zopfia rhizophila CBS 207.26]|uniref:Uncharacterized protein n=1 Tax=Zopfia rhizophila CBS 207.26 TaxID=1314779 RepID=A0A6A6EHC6_9PEZI|nr:hypothetical protein K469DRAFT_700725 [Zopfia rhizophila CBS 207.26]